MNLKLFSSEESVYVILVNNLLLSALKNSLIKIIYIFSSMHSHMGPFYSRHLQSMNHFNHHQSTNHSTSNNSSTHHPSSSESSNSISEHSSSRSQSEKKKNHIKKPLNAFMMFMKEMRPQVQAECTLKESAAINQILGRRVRHFLWLFLLLKWNFKRLTIYKIKWFICVNNVHVQRNFLNILILITSNNFFFFSIYFFIYGVKLSTYKSHLTLSL